MASRKLGKKGESKSLNRWFRARIIFQGATIGAIVAGSYVMKNKQDSGGTQEALSVGELKAKERVEFEERLRKAEETHEMEQVMRGGRPKEPEKGIWARLGLGRGPAGSVRPLQTDSESPRNLQSAQTPPPPEPAPSTPTSQPTEVPKTKYWNWFGKGSSKPSDSERK